VAVTPSVEEVLTHMSSPERAVQFWLELENQNRIAASFTLNWPPSMTLAQPLMGARNLMDLLKKTAMDASTPPVYDLAFQDQLRDIVATKSEPSARAAIVEFMQNSPKYVPAQVLVDEAIAANPDPPPPPPASLSNNISGPRPPLPIYTHEYKREKVFTDEPCTKNFLLYVILGTALPAFIVFIICIGMIIWKKVKAKVPSPIHTSLPPPPLGMGRGGGMLLHPPPSPSFGMGRGGGGMPFPPPPSNGMGRGMPFPPPPSNGMGRGMPFPPPPSNGMGRMPFSFPQGKR
jgi:hypothetical protein